MAGIATAAATAVGSGDWLGDSTCKTLILHIKIALPVRALFAHQHEATLPAAVAATVSDGLVPATLASGACAFNHAP
jgi:hypothetical protein